MHEAKSKLAQKLSLLLLTAALANGTLGETPALGEDRPPRCVESTVLLLGARYPDELAADGDANCYQVTVEQRGVLLASVSSHQLEPKLRLRDDVSSGKAAVPLGSSSSGRLVLQVREPVSLTFEVAPQDPRRSFQHFVFTSRFVPETDAIEVELYAARLPVATKEGDEIDPVLVTGNDSPSILFATKEGDEIDPVLITGNASLPAPFSTKEGDEIDPVLLSSPQGDRHLRFLRSGLLLLTSGRAALGQAGDEIVLRAATGATALFYDLCLPDPTDDHAGLLACASPLRAGSSLRGELISGWTEDHDTFTFTLDEQRTVTFDTDGVVRTSGALYDRKGYRLALVEDTEAVHFRFVRSLAPGRYFVRIIGRDREQGRYTVSMATSAW